MPEFPSQVTMPLKFTDAEADEARALIQRAVAEDLPQGDATTDPLLGPQSPAAGASAEAVFAAREPGILCGAPVVVELYRLFAQGVAVQEGQPDGTPFEAGDTVMRVSGPADAMLRLERIALNFLQRLSGIATVTARWRRELDGLDVQLLDTRKTTPGWRRLEKYAVRAGGGVNHRMGLSDGLLLKDNHIAILSAVQQRGAGAPTIALSTYARELRKAHPDLFLQVEVDTREQFLAVVDCELDAILLDNFSLADLSWAVKERNARGHRPLLEASGALQLHNIRAVAETGVDRVSVGALTHSCRWLDIGLDIEKTARK